MEIINPRTVYLFSNEELDENIEFFIDKYPSNYQEILALIKEKQYRMMNEISMTKYETDPIEENIKEKKTKTGRTEKGK